MREAEGGGGSRPSYPRMLCTGVCMTHGLSTRSLWMRLWVEMCTTIRPGKPLCRVPSGAYQSPTSSRTGQEPGQLGDGTGGEGYSIRERRSIPEGATSPAVRVSAGERQDRSRGHLPARSPVRRRTHGGCGDTRRSRRLSGLPGAGRRSSEAPRTHTPRGLVSFPSRPGRPPPWRCAPGPHRPHRLLHRALDRNRSRPADGLAWRVRAQLADRPAEVTLTWIWARFRARSPHSGLVHRPFTRRSLHRWTTAVRLP